MATAVARRHVVTRKRHRRTRLVSFDDNFFISSTSFRLGCTMLDESTSELVEESSML